jgi:two-component system chemotaxis sensor kinase CheA
MDLIAPDQDLSEDELFGLIFMPGFSTAKKVSSVSGRGVGMDVVKREIETLRGSVSITSQEGQGTTISLTLPLTLAIIDGLLVRVDDDKYVIPVSLIDECLELINVQYAMGRGRNVVQVRGEAIPFIRLREVFKISGEAPELEEMVIVHARNLMVGLVVDHVLGDHQTVIKSLGKAFRNVEGISGATILGDGSVALVIDVLSLRLIQLMSATSRHY